MLYNSLNLSSVIKFMDKKSRDYGQCCLCWHSGKRKPIRIIEKPTPLQAEIFSVFGYKIKGGVLQKISRQHLDITVFLLCFDLKKESPINK